MEVKIIKGPHFEQVKKLAQKELAKHIRKEALELKKQQEMENKEGKHLSD